jgi:hypothetical protein
MDEITCVGINNLNECFYATLGSGSFGCKYDRPCKYKRPELYEYSESLQKELEAVKVTMNHARVFISSREKMHSAGVDLWDEQVKRIDKLLKGGG